MATIREKFGVFLRRFHTILRDSSGVAGGVVVQDAFKDHFLVDANGNISDSDVTNVSGNVVSVLQAGAFFGALGSAPISGMPIIFIRVSNRSSSSPYSTDWKEIHSFRVYSRLRPWRSTFSDPNFPLLSSLTNILHILQLLQTIAGSDGRGLGYIYGGRVVAGIGIGAISAVAPAYVSECSPKNVRGRITGLFQIMVAIGVMLSYFINCEVFHIWKG